jgi:hypothetical protein
MAVANVQVYKPTVLIRVVKTFIVQSPDVLKKEKFELKSLMTEEKVRINPIESW